VNSSQQNQQFTCKQTIDQSQLSDRARNCRRIKMVSIWQISCVTRQKLGNLRSQTANSVAQQSWATLLRVWHRPNVTVCCPPAIGGCFTTSSFLRFNRSHFERHFDRPQPGMWQK